MAGRERVGCEAATTGRPPNPGPVLTRTRCHRGDAVRRDTARSAENAFAYGRRRYASSEHSQSTWDETLIGKLSEARSPQGRDETEGIDINGTQDSLKGGLSDDFPS